MASPFIAQITLFAGNFAPRGYAFCNGQILPIAQNQALFALLGTTYGGNGQTTFALPNLQGRVPIHPGQGQGLSPYSLGQAGGTENVTLNISQMPAHNHAATSRASAGGADDSSPTNNFLAADNQYSTTQNTQMNANEIQVSPNGGSQSHTNVQPYLAINFIIALQGIFPSRN